MQKSLLVEEFSTPIEFAVPRTNGESTHTVRQAADGSWELYLNGFDDPIRTLNEFESGFINGAFGAGADFGKRIACLI